MKTDPVTVLIKSHEEIMEKRYIIIIGKIFEQMTVFITFKKNR